MNNIIPYLLILCLPLLYACEKSERKQNLRGEYIYRLSGEYFFLPPPPQPKAQREYPWDRRYVGAHPRITKEFFRCRGNPHHPLATQPRTGKEPLYHRDCIGSERHGLPLVDGKEYIYPILIDLLNFVQEKTGKRVVITTGHRCPDHNLYCDWHSSNWSSKHMLGAEVDFYVEGMEKEPETIIALLQEYYKEDPERATFRRYERAGLNVKTLPWCNSEIFIKLYLENEGRDFDNQHPYPYIGIQVRYDREKKCPVVFDQEQAQNYLRY